MKERIAVRNLRLCTKDCLCLYVCPTGASDTEDSVIDVTRCIGCGVCAGACPHFSAVRPNDGEIRPIFASSVRKNGETLVNAAAVWYTVVQQEIR